MIEIIVIALISIVAATFITSTLIYKKRYKNMIMTVAQLVLDKAALSEKIDQQIAASSKEVNEGFIKFLSDSREAAFEYIENVQIAIKNYLDAINSGEDDRITVTRLELFNHLPESEDETEE